ncbi:class I SAM-dependent methyltransferase [Mesorhizobium sp. YC-39]|uniref:class I SAM-dependent methyltransferase n=1 Tax=unclassified Mesorhizobium TaxID=325217 RepID=UPI0021E92E1E|nr:MULTISPECIES: class I SAM-dependent methyltransferase [unclassified Mesorhizobium]MCV3210528.1 class I SAM-dependent methyltransferase [Mesorhizobium sp. YC-2]MCV3232574.1 class I SAM-dependent methyltransferase [Mesorhizobium sp. YC-39]
MNSDLPAEFDPQFYAATYGDLRGRDARQLRAHYEAYGRAEGRIASPAARRSDFLQLVPTTGPVLEIGPFYAPCIRGRNVSYFDVLDRQALTRRAAKLGRRTDSVPEINYVDSRGDLSVVKDTFAAVVSSHCIEHQPDLVHHLLQVAAVLAPGGRYFLLIPNKLYCFDHFIAESTIAGVLDAHYAKRRVHSLQSVVEHRALTTHNVPTRHWAGDHADLGYMQSIAKKATAALAEYEAAGGDYIDVHAWQFIPESFRQIAQCLVDLGLSDLRPERIYDSPRDCNEFAAVLRKQ